MRFGCVARNVGPDCIDVVRTLPRVLEELGYASVWFTDHVIGLAAYRPVYTGEWAEALTAMSWAASTTERIRIGASVLVAPMRNAVYAAKVVATLDQLSGGRVDLGVGTGWAYREFEALGRADLFERRGDVTDETLAVFRRCWQGGTFGWHGRHVSFKEIEFAPVPIQRPGPPLWIAGSSNRALRRAAEWADVWHPSGLAPASLSERGTVLDALAGRSVARSIRLAGVSRSSSDIRKLADAYAAVGCEDIILEFESTAIGQLITDAQELARAVGL